MGRRAIPNGRVICVGNLKGGTAKSTLAVNLACALASEHVQDVLIVDTDPQGTAHRWSNGGRLPVDCRALPLQNLATASGWLGQTEILRAAYDVVVIDLPAVVPPATAAAFMMADVILVPIAPSAVDIDGAARALRYLRVAREQRAGDQPIAMVVPTRVVGQVDRSRPRGPIADFPGLGEQIAPPIRHDPLFVAAYDQRRWVGDIAPNSNAAKDIRRIAKLVWSSLRRRDGDTVEWLRRGERRQQAGGGRRTERGLYAASALAEASGPEELSRRRGAPAQGGRKRHRFTPMSREDRRRWLLGETNQNEASTKRRPSAAARAKAVEKTTKAEPAANAAAEIGFLKRWMNELFGRSER